MIAKSVPARARTRTFTVGIEYITEHTHQRALALAGSAFEGGVTYATAPGKAAWVHLHGVSTVGSAAHEMEIIAALTSRCKDPVYHLIIAYAKNEYPTREQVIGDAERLLAAVGMREHQYVLSAHQDTDDFHAHVIANRVGRDGKANDLWNERILRERVCAKIAAERGWDIVVGHHNRDIVRRVERLHEMPNAPARGLLDGEYRRLHERGELPWQDIARPYVLDAVDRAQSWENLHRRLDAHGVVVKLIQRGDRVQGLAFSEGRDAGAPGCGASRIDKRCAWSALKVRFGAFVSSPEVARDAVLANVPSSNGNTENVSASWGDLMRTAIMAEIDVARSWSDLSERLERHGVLIKLVQRGGYVQGFAFAQGYSVDAPGCSASRCKKALLEERFGLFPDAAQEHTRYRERGQEAAEERLREARATQESRQMRGGVGGSERALHEAGHIVDHARMRSEYAAYRRRFFAEKRIAGGERYATAWEREKAQRAQEARERRKMRAFLSAVARIASRGPLRQIAYWSINATLERRRIHDFATAHARWAAVKSTFSIQRRQPREEETPMEYQAFVRELARAGDVGAQRVAAAFVPPQHPASVVWEERTEMREQQAATERQPQLPALTIDEVRSCLQTIREKEMAWHDRAKHEREVALEVIEQPDDLREMLSLRREEIVAEVTEKTAFTEEEQARLKQWEAEKKSWNPLKRAAALEKEKMLLDAQRIRHERALYDAMLAFEMQEVSVHTERVNALDRTYDAYLRTSLALEKEVNDAWCVVNQRVPACEEQLIVIERAGGMSRIEGIGQDAKLGEIAEAVGQCYGSVPEATREEIEAQVRSEQRAFERLRDSMSMDR